MIIYNVTVILEDSIHNQWVNWMKQVHLPEMMNTNCFVSNRILKILDSPNEGVTYCVQFMLENMEKYHMYESQFASHMRANHPVEFENKFVRFRSLMEVVDWL